MNEMFCTGDLIKIPSNVKMMKESKDQQYVKSFKVTERPKIGIFVKYLEYGKCMIDSDGEKWSVDTNYLRMCEVKNDKTYSNIEAL
tara:strand:+ start:32 stop:289 length:258 start_codon:yes stop_codon:yes gene_type:complete